LSTAAAIGTSNVSAGDRLLVMLFLAGLFHLIVILGVSFAAPPADPSLAPTLEVLLVSNALPETAADREAAYLAQRSQQGSGTPEQASRLPRPADAAEDQLGLPDGSSLPPAPDGLAGGEASVLAGAGPSLRQFAEATTPAGQSPSLAREQLAGDAALLPAGTDDAGLRLKGRERRELLVTPATRTAAAAVYLDAWKRRVEQVGTLHFPNAARRRLLSGNPVVEVALDDSGRLVEARVRRSSGHPELDQAALEILRLASPFEGFPPGLAEQHDLLRFAYEWQFVAGRLAGSTVGLPADSR
jgi:protein TonB